MSILVLEDRPERQQGFREHFPDCRVVSTYAAAVEVLAALRFDVVYLDFDIEVGRNGNDVAFFMATLPLEMRPARVVVHSSNLAGGMAIQQTLRRAGFQVEWWQYPPWPLW
jgi:CheY-like chemotaxis protein